MINRLLTFVRDIFKRDYSEVNAAIASFEGREQFNKVGKDMSELYFEKWTDAISSWDKKRWPNFHVKEFAQGIGTPEWHAGKTPVMICENFLDKLQHLRDLYARPIIITSGYRSPEYNARVSSTGKTGPHTTGRAVDIAVYGEHALEIVSLAPQCGFTGVGVKQNGDYSGRFIHLDDLDDYTPRPWLWSY